MRNWKRLVKTIGRYKIYRRLDGRYYVFMDDNEQDESFDSEDTVIRYTKKLSSLDVSFSYPGNR